MFYKIDKTLINQARKKYPFGALGNSITAGGGNIYGALGELITIEHYKQKGADVRDVGCLDYDLLINGLRVDVKSRVVKDAKRVAGWYRCTIPAYSIRQDTEYYIFVMICKQMNAARIVGGISKAEFLQLARLYYAGEPDADGFRFPCNTYQIIVRQLKKI